MRTLIHIPIIHSEVDLGSLAHELRRRSQETFGVNAWAQRLAAITRMWEQLQEQLRTLPLTGTTRLYQDGLPVCGKEREIVQELASKGSVNHQILAMLMERGALLMGTESPELLVREYRRGQQLIQATQRQATGKLVEALRHEGEAMLRERDAFMAHRIDSTLQEGETGLLFLGLLHRTHELLEGKLELRPLTHHLPLGHLPQRQAQEHKPHGR